MSTTLQTILKQAYIPEETQEWIKATNITLTETLLENKFLSASMVKYFLTDEANISNMISNYWLSNVEINKIIEKATDKYSLLFLSEQQELEDAALHLIVEKANSKRDLEDPANLSFDSLTLRRSFMDRPRPKRYPLDEIHPKAKFVAAPQSRGGNTKVENLSDTSINYLIHGMADKPAASWQVFVEVIETFTGTSEELLTYVSTISK